jgi:sterol 14alpha-demethylase
VTRLAAPLAGPPLVSGRRPVVGHALELMRDPLGLMLRGQREHGDVFALALPGRRTVALLGPEHNRLVFAETDRRLSFSLAYPFLVRMLGPESAISSDEAYEEKRPLMMPFFRSGALGPSVTSMELETRRFVDRLGGSGEFEMTATFGELTLAVAARTLLGDETSVDIAVWSRRYHDLAAGFDPITPGWLPAPHLLRSRRAGKTLRAALRDLLAIRRASPGARPDFLQHLADSRDRDGRPLSDEAATALALGLLVAAQKTTAGHLSWALIDLIRHPEHIERIRAEVRTRGLAPPLTVGALHRLDHLLNCLRETERLHPIIALILRVATEPLEAGGYRIDPGTSVLLSPAASHRRPAQFPDPDAFHPDRFTGGDAAAQLIGFGGGAHRCLGMRFAQLEMCVVLSQLLAAYDFWLLDPDPRPNRNATTAKWPQATRVRYRRRG